MLKFLLTLCALVLVTRSIPIPCGGNGNGQNAGGLCGKTQKVEQPRPAPIVVKHKPPPIIVKEDPLPIILKKKPAPIIVQEKPSQTPIVVKEKPHATTPVVLHPAKVEEKTPCEKAGDKKTPCEKAAEKKPAIEVKTESTPTATNVKVESKPHVQEKKTPCEANKGSGTNTSPCTKKTVDVSKFQVKSAPTATKPTVAKAKPTAAQTKDTTVKVVNTKPTPTHDVQVKAKSIRPTAGLDFEIPGNKTPCGSPENPCGAATHSNAKDTPMMNVDHVDEDTRKMLKLLESLEKTTQ